jgi:NAD-dependent dihydropyrimidine dehydrogenase PreA subunit
VGKVTYVVAAVLAAFFCLTGDALADGMMLKRHTRKVVVHPSGCIGCIVRRPVCPDSCNSPYGAYGPFGGHAYWTRYTRGGWYP